PSGPGGRRENRTAAARARWLLPSRTLPLRSRSIQSEGQLWCDGKMVRKPGSKHSAPSSRVTARRNDWNSIRVLHQGPRPPAASRGRIHDRSPIRLPKHQKSLADRGPSIHDGVRKVVCRQSRRDPSFETRPPAAPQDEVVTLGTKSDPHGEEAHRAVSNHV